MVEGGALGDFRPARQVPPCPAAPSPLPMRIMADVPGRSSPALADQPIQLAGQARGVRYAADQDRPRRRVLPFLLAMTPPAGHSPAAGNPGDAALQDCRRALRAAVMPPVKIGRAARRPTLCRPRCHRQCIRRTRPAHDATAPDRRCVACRPPRRRQPRSVADAPPASCDTSMRYEDDLVVDKIKRRSSVASIHKSARRQSV